jgi:hypothetical protein
MTRNQKIALGCGGAGCLGLIVVAIAAGLIYFFSVSRSFSTNRNYNYNTNTSNRNYNLNSNANDNSNTSTSPSAATPASSLSDDDQHKLYQAALMTGDDQLLRRVSVKLGLMNEDYTYGDKYEQFVTDHAGWVIRNFSFISSISSQEKARAYVDQNFPD